MEGIRYTLADKSRSRVKSKGILFLSLLVKRASLLFFLLTLFFTSSYGATITWNLPGGGAWTTGTNWVGGVAPVNGDDVVINMTAAGTITAVPTITLNSMSIGGAFNTTLSGAAGVTVTINNTNATSALNVVSGGTITLGGGTGATQVNLTFQTITTPTTIAGTLNISASSTLADGGNTITIGGNVINNGTHSGTGEINLTGGSAAHAISGAANIFGNLELSDNFGATFTGTGATTLTGNLIVTQGTLTLNAFTTSFTVNGVTNIGIGAGTGNLTFASAAVTRTFTGLVTLGSNGTWNNSANATDIFQGGISNSGTFTAGTGIQTFNTNSQSLTGTLSIPSVTVTGAGLILTNNNTLTVITALAGTGGLTQSANATLNLGITPTISSLIATANGNTVNYNAAGAQTIVSTNYYNLLLGGSGVKTLQAGTTSIGGILSLSGTASTTTAANLTITGNLTIGDGTTFTVGAFTLTVTGTTTIGNGLSGNLTFSSVANPVMTFDGLITLNSGSWNENQAVTPIFNGGIENLGGTINTSTGVHTFNTNPQTLSGPITIPNVTVTGITLTNDGTFTVTNNLTGSGGLTNTVAGTLTIGNTVSNITLNAGAVGNTVIYNGTAQSIFPVNYYNLTLLGSGVMTFQSGTTTISNNLSITGSSALLVPGTTITSNYLYLNSVNQSPGTWGSTTSAATNQNNTYFAPSTGIVNVTAGSCTTGTWLGTTSTDWNNPSNWCGGVPIATTNVIIPVVANEPKFLTAGGVCNNITINNGATLTMNGAYTLTVTGNWTNNGGTFTPSTSTVIFNGTSQTIGGTGVTTFYNVSTSGSATVTTAATVTIGGNLSIADPSTFTAGGFALTVTGTTSIGTGTSGTLSINNAAGTKTFTGVVTINAGASFVETAAAQLAFGSDVMNNGIMTESGAAVVGLAGNFTNNGTYTASTGIHTFSGTAKAIGGTSANVIPTATFTGAYTNNGTLTDATLLTVTGTTLTNNGTINASTSLAGVGGNLINSATGTLNIGGTSGITTLTAGAIGNTVNYNGAGAQMVFNTNYYNLILSGSGVKTLQAGTTSIGGNLTLSGTATTTTAANFAITGNLAIGDGTTFTVPGFTLGVTGTTTIGNGTSGTLTISNVVGTKTFTGAVLINTGGTLNETVPAQLFFGSNLTIGGTLTENGAAVVGIAGNLTNNGTYTASTGVHTFSGATGTIGGSTANVIPSATFTGAYTNNGTLTDATSLTVTGTTLTNNGTITISTALAGATGTLFNASTGVLNINFAGPPTIGTLNATSPGNIVNYGLAGAQNIYNTTYDGLTLSGNNTKTITGTVVTNILNFSGAATLAIGANSLTANTVNRNNAIAVTISTGTFTVNGNLTLANADPITFTGAGILNVTGNLICGNITLNAGTINVSGNLTCATLTGNTGTINIGGTFSPTTYTINTSTVNFNSSSPQNISAYAYYNVTSSNGGVKSLAGNASVAGTLNLASGKILLGANNLTLSGTTGLLAITGTFSGTNMIETDGTGMLIFSNAALVGTDLNGIYPIGNNSDYNPVSAAGFTGAGANRSFSISVVSGQPFVDGINRYWNINQTGVTGDPTLSFTYLTTEASSDYTKYQLYTNLTGSWGLAPSASAAGVNPMTSTTTAVLPPSSEWTASTPGGFYSYQTGNWNNPSTWTNDPSGTTLINPLNAIPGDLDAVTILTGITVTLSTNVTSASNNITINGGGYLNLSSYQFTNSILTLGGQGTLQLSTTTGYFPTVITNTFVNAGGGTVEYDANTNMPVTQLTYNNLTINAPTFIVTLTSNINLNGNLWIEQGTFQVNDASANMRKLTILGNVTVNNGASFTVGTGNTTTTTVPTGINTTVAGPFINYYDQESHRIVVNGNFTNNGTVRMTNLTTPVYNAFPTNGIATVYFRGSTNNTLTCNGTTDFYNLVLDKGSDQTYILSVYSSAYNNFRLFGANTAAFDILMGASNANPNLKKALWVRNGTLDLTGLIAIPSLTEGATAYPTTPTSDYFIPSNGAMIIDDPFVNILATADDYTEVNAAYGLSGGSDALYGINTSGAGSGLAVLGKLQITDGYLSTRESSGLLYWSYASGQLIINGGTIDTKQIHNPEGGANGLISYSQTGGNVILRGRFQNMINYTTVASLTTPVIITARNASGTDATAGIGTFSINSNVGNGFAMSGGTVSIYDVCGTTAPTDAIYVGCPTSNINVTGGTIQIIPTTGTVLADANYLINTISPFGNLIVNQASGTSIVQLNTNPINVLQNLTIQSGTFDANLLNVDIGGNFSIASGSTYTCTAGSANRTIFYGSSNQTFTAGAVTLNSLILNKSAGVLKFPATPVTITIADSLMILGGQLNDNGNVINAQGGVYNAGTESGTGKIAMVGTNTQTIDGNGSGIFNNLDINNTNAAASPVSLTAAITVKGTLNLVSNKIFTIGTYNLLISSSGSITSTAGLSNSCYIQGSGNAGDGGISKVYTSNTPFLFPVGCFSTNRPSTPAYTPATIGFSTSPATYGTITVTPVGYEDPTTIVKGQSLTYFWKINSSGFTGSYAVTHTFVYSSLDVNGNINNYVPSLYNGTNYTWNSGLHSNINTGTYTFTDWTAPTNSTTFLNANYTAGDNTTGGGAFGTVKVYYSLASGLWSSLGTWTFNSTHTGAQAGSIPGANNAVVIGNKDSVYLTNKAYNSNSNSVNCASLQIDVGSSLDIDNNPSSVFSTVVNSPLGNGTIRIGCSNAATANFVFPNGDFSAFNENLGTTVLYTNNNAAGTTYWLPNNITNYGNLILAPVGGSNVIFGNTNVLIYGNLTTTGESSDSWFCPTWGSAGSYPGGINAIAKTITINGNLNIQGGSLIWYQNGAVAQNFVVYGNVTVNDSSALYVYSGGTNQSMWIGGSLINNADGLTHAPAGTPDNCDFTTIPVTFFGPNNAYITNTKGTPYTKFSTLTINKGSSQATTLTFNITGTPTYVSNDNWLTIQNGTLIYNNPTNLNITTGSTFTIPATAGLTVNTTGNVNIAQGNVSTNTFYLDGKLTLTNGTINVGLATNNQHNDIEYSSGGASTIEIDGGSLVVNGAIRRNPSDASGVLSYTQTGSSSVTVNGNTALATNAKLEVLNSGSQFNMSGTSILNIVRGGGGNSFGDLYLRPQSGLVTGSSTIVFSQGALAAQNYQLDANLPLNNLTITGAANNAKVELMVDSLIINGNLTLSNANSILNAVSVSGNSINVNFNGNVINKGTVASYLYGTNLTTFSEPTSYANNGIQSITGTAINFYNLNVNPGASLQLCGNTTVANILTISSGTLICGTNKVSVSGNFTNNGNYTDNNALGTGISLVGASSQQIAGTGSFGWLELNNPAGAVLNNSITLNEHLTMTSGILNVQQNLLTLQQNSTIDPNVTPFSVTKMVTTNGVLGNIGINKFFTTVPQSFVYPIGTSGKYTPAMITFSASGYVGSVRINNINSTQPTVIDPANALKYYWDVQSSGISGFQGTLTLHYLSSDVVGGPESSYQTAWLISPGTSWSINEGPVYPTPGDSLQFNYLSGTENLSGEYTAGLGEAFPSIVPTYTSTKSGIWNDPTVWTQTAGTPHTLSTGPNGFIVVIQTGNTVTASNNNCWAYQTTINGKLVIDAGTYGHNFGTVTGNGTLTLQSGLFPAGNYSSFLSCLSGGTVEYSGSGNYTIVADLYSSIPNILFSGTGSRVLPDKALTICNSFIIGTGADNPTVDNSVYNQHLTILGSMQYYSGTFISGSGSNATVTLAGTSAQTIGGATGNFTGANSFNNFEINNSAGLTVNPGGAVSVNGNLLLTSGLINTTATSTLTITNTAINCVVPAGGSATSYVNGPLNKLINQGDDFAFPIGQGTLPGNRILLSNIQTGPIIWTAQYFDPNPTSNSFAAPLVVVSWDEYWSVTPSSASQANINLNYYPNSDITPLVTVGGLGNMTVATYNAGQWNNISSTASGTNYNGTVATNAVVSIPATPTNFTLAAITSVTPKAKLSPTGPVCGSAGIPVTFSTSGSIPFNYVLNYTMNGIAQTPVTITSAMIPYSLPTSFAGNSATYILTGFTYNNGAGTGVVDVTPVTAYASPSTANAGSNQSVCGITSVTLNGNTPTIGTGTWSVVSGTGGTLFQPNNPLSQFNGILPNSYTLQWTISNGTCLSTSDVSVAFTTRPTPPNAAPAQSFCNAAAISNISVSATMGFVNWYSSSTYPPTPPALASTTALTSGTTYYADAVSGTCISASPLTPVTITINPNPAAITGAGSVCTGSTITLSDATPGGTWSSGSPTVATVNASTGVVTGISAGPSVITYTLTATGCSVNTTVMVNPSPVLIITNPAEVCSPSTVDITAASVTAGSTLYGGTLSYWSDPGATIPYTTPTTSGSGTYYIEATVPVTGCIAIDPVTVTVNPLPTITTAAAAGAVCYSSVAQNTSLTYSAVTNAPASYTITWNAAALAAGLVNVSASPLPASPITVPVSANVAAGTYTGTIVVTNANGCASTGTNFTVTVNPLPTITTPATAGAVCYSSVAQNTSLTYSAVTNAPASYTITWNAAALTAGLVNVSTTALPASPITIPITAGVSAGTYTGTLNVTNANGCTSLGNSFSVTINPLPAVITGTTNVCAGLTSSLNDATPGGTWSSGTTAVATVDASGDVTGVSAGTSVITYTLTATGCSVNTTVTVNPDPVLIITNPAPVCAPATIDITAASVTAGSILFGGTLSYWSDAGATVPYTTPTTSGSGTYYIEATVPVTGCIVVEPVTVTVNLLPASITGTMNVCTGLTTALNDATPGGTWISGTPAVATVNASGVVTGVSAGTSVITYTLTATGCSINTSVTVNPNPVLIITNPAPVCAPATVDITAASVTAGSNLYGGTLSYWSDAGATVPYTTPTTSGSGTYYIEATVPVTGCIAVEPVIVTVNPLPAAITGTMNVCVGLTIALNDTNPGGTWNSGTPTVATVNASGVVTGIAVGTSVITYTLPTGCNISTTVTVDPVPNTGPLYRTPNQ